MYDISSLRVKLVLYSPIQKERRFLQGPALLSAEHWKILLSLFTCIICISVKLIILTFYRTF